VLASVHQHVDNPNANHAGRFQRARVISIAPDRPANAERTIHCARQPNREPSHPAREHVPIRRLDDEVRVIVLDRELDDAKRVADRRRKAGFANGLAHFAKEPHVAKRGQTGAGPERDMDGMCRGVTRPRPMRRVRPPSVLRLATGAPALAAARPPSKRELRTHDDWAIFYIFDVLTQARSCIQCRILGGRPVHRPQHRSDPNDRPRSRPKRLAASPNATAIVSEPDDRRFPAKTAHGRHRSEPNDRPRSQPKGLAASVSNTGRTMAPPSQNGACSAPFGTERSTPIPAKMA